MLFIRAAIGMFFVVLCSSSYSYAAIYKYVDENGVIFYTDAPPFGVKAEKTSISAQPGKNPSKPQAKKPKTQNHQEIIHEKSRKYDIDPSLVKAVIKTESDFNPYAVSRKGAMGLMQLMPFTAREMGVYNPYDAEENIEGGTRYLKSLLDKFGGNLTLALAAYNAGPSKVERFGKVPPIEETRQYVRKVLTLYGGASSYDYSGYSSGPSLKVQREPIYKVILEDGTVLYTNSSFLKADPARF